MGSADNTQFQHSKTSVMIWILRKHGGEKGYLTHLENRLSKS